MALVKFTQTIGGDISIGNLANRFVQSCQTTFMNALQIASQAALYGITFTPTTPVVRANVSATSWTQILADLGLPNTTVGQQQAQNLLLIAFQLSALGQQETYLQQLITGQIVGD